MFDFEFGMTTAISFDGDLYFFSIFSSLLFQGPPSLLRSEHFPLAA
jgi:hypothetical protein